MNKYLVVYYLSYIHIIVLAFVPFFYPRGRYSAA